MKCGPARSISHPSVVAITALLVAFGPIVRSAGQAVEAEQEEQTALVYHHVDTDDADLSPDERTAIVLALFSQLSERMPEFEFLPLPSVEAPRSYVYEHDGIGWVEVDVSGDREELIAEVSVYPVRSAYPLVEETVTGPFDWRLSALSAFWQPAVSAWEERSTDMIDIAVREMHPGVLTLTGSPGTRVSRLDNGSGGIPSATDEPVELDESGRLQLELAMGRVYSFEATAPGYYPRSHEVFLGEREKTVELDLRRRSRLFYDVLASHLTYPEVGIGIVSGGGRFYARFGVESYIAGFVPAASGGTGISGALVSEPLSQLHLQTGVYLRSGNRNVRPFFGLGGFSRIVHGSYWGFERQAPAGVRASAGLEFGSRGPWRFLLELRPDLYATRAPDEFRANAPEDFDFVRPDFPVGDTGYSGFFDPFGLAVGIRFQPSVEGGEPVEGDLQ